MTWTCKKHNAGGSGERCPICEVTPRETLQQMKRQADRTLRRFIRPDDTPPLDLDLEEEALRIAIAQGFTSESALVDFRAAFPRIAAPWLGMERGSAAWAAGLTQSQVEDVIRNPAARSRAFHTRPLQDGLKHVTLKGAGLDGHVCEGCFVYYNADLDACPRCPSGVEHEAHIYFQNRTRPPVHRKISGPVLVVEAGLWDDVDRIVINGFMIRRHPHPGKD